MEEAQVLLGREAIRIYVKYFTKNSEYEINVTAKEKKELEEKLRAPDAKTFDAVQNEIFGLMAMVISLVLLYTLSLSPYSHSQLVY